MWDTVATLPNAVKPDPPNSRKRGRDKSRFERSPDYIFSRFGAGSITTLLSLKAEYASTSILLAIATKLFLTNTGIHLPTRG